MVKLLELVLCFTCVIYDVCLQQSLPEWAQLGSGPEVLGRGLAALFRLLHGLQVRDGPSAWRLLLLTPAVQEEECKSCLFNLKRQA